MEPGGTDVTMELICELAVVNRVGGVTEDFSWVSITARNMSKESTPPEEEPFIIVRTSSYDTGTRYNLIGNIEGLSTQFINDGSSTVCLKEPSCNIIITNADPKKLKAFMAYVKEQSPKDSPVHVANTALETSIPQINLNAQEKYRYKLRMENIIRNTKFRNVDLCGQTKYKLEMENIIRLNTNLDHFTHLQIWCCTLELADDQVPIAGAIRNMKNLTTLRLKRIDLRSSTFLEIESKELKQLHLCWCKTRLPIASLFKNDLCYKDSLVELRLEGNRWSEIPNGIFQFQNLLKLSFSNNRITKLPDKITNLPKLQELELSRNKIRRLPPSIYELQNLLKLSLCNNSITELPNISTNSSKLQVLSLCHNRLTHLPPSIFALQNLSKLQLDSNCITELPNMFANLSTLQVLSLSHNQIRHLPASIFTLQNLSELSLSGNFITELPDMFTNLPKLNTLLLCNNQLRSVPSSIFALQNLSELGLSNNGITELPDRFTNLPKLKVLSLSGNQLQYLPRSICLLHLKQLDVANNDFDFKIPPPSFGSEPIVHSLKELSYRTILKHKLIVKEGMLPNKFVKDLENYHQCICGRKFVDEGQDLFYIRYLGDISHFGSYNCDVRVPVRCKLCTSFESCYMDHFE